MFVGLVSTLLAVSAQAVPIGPGNTTGFEIEGNLLDDGSTPGVDWNDFIGDASLSLFTDDTADSGIAGKEQDPSDWTCNTGGANPGKANILRVALHPRITASATFLDLAYLRQAGNGDTHVNVEFNQGPVVVDCADTALEGRLDGDLMLLFNFPGNSGANVEVYRWDNTPPAGVVGDQNPADGAWIFSASLPVGVATGAENPAAITQANDPMFNVAIGDRQFGEASLDLGAILGEGIGSSTCTRFGSVSFRSRSSGESITSALQDILGPNPVNLSTCGQITIHKTDDAGNALPGATFGLYTNVDDADDRTNPVATCLSIANGNCVFPEVAPGSYFIAEISAPLGYNPDVTPLNGVIGPIVVAFRQQVDVAAPFVDPRQVGFVRINKTLVSATGDPLTPDDLADLNGATFVLRQGGQVASLWPTPPTNDPATCTISNSQGFCIIGPVPIGTYEVVETVAPPGTTPGDQPDDVTVTEGTSPQAVVVPYPNISETPTVTIAKTATPTEVLEPGGDVLFDVVITNTSITETLTLDTLDDDVFGDLFDGANAAISGNTCDDLAGDQVAPGANVACSFTGHVTGNAGDPDHVNVVTVVATDDEDQEATANDDATVDFDDLAALVVEKTADPTSVPEPGDDVTFTVDISNSSDLHSITLDSIIDTVYGDLGDPANPDVTDNTCIDLIGDVLGPLGNTSCTFVGFVGPDANPNDLSEHENTVTVTGTDDEQNVIDDDDDAIVDITDVTPTVGVTKTADDGSIPENTPTPITFTVVVSNDSVEPVTILSLDDDVFGAQVGDADCHVGTVLPVDGSCTFTFVGVVSGDFQDPSHTNTFTVVVRDDEGNTDDASDPETVDFEDVPPTVVVDKTADPGTAPEGTPTLVDFTVVVTNGSNEAVTIESLEDDVFGTLAGDADCQVGTVLGVGGSCTFTFSEELTGDAGADHTDVVTVVVIDDDGTTGQEDDDATVTFTDVLPTVTVTKDSDTDSINDGSSAQVTFTVVVTNGSVEPVTITSLSDSVFGVLDGDADCKVGTVLAIGGSCTFTFVKTVAGNVAAPHSNVVTVVVTDDEGGTGSDVDDETIAVTPTTVATTTTLPTEVLGVQQTQALPRTGADSLRMAMAAIGIVSLGAGFVLLSVYAEQRRRYQF